MALFIYPEEMEFTECYTLIFYIIEVLSLSGNNPEGRIPYHYGLLKNLGETK